MQLESKTRPRDPERIIKYEYLLALASVRILGSGELALSCLRVAILAEVIGIGNAFAVLLRIEGYQKGFRYVVYLLEASDAGTFV